MKISSDLLLGIAGVLIWVAGRARQLAILQSTNKGEFEKQCTQSVIVILLMSLVFLVCLAAVQPPL